MKMSNNRANRRTLSGTAGGFSFLSQITDRTAEQFVEEILKIHDNQYTPINHIPTILGRKIDLLALYNAVAKRGGFKKMNTEWSWEGVLSDLNMPIKCANASVALRTIYQRYLEPFERIQRNKATINDIEEELQMESETRYKTAQRTTLSHCNFNSSSMVYRTDVHQISSHKRQESALSCDLSDVVEFQKLELSLKSGLVNEIEVALNTLLLMSSQTDGVQLCRNHRLLDAVLSTIGIGSLELIRDHSAHQKSTRRFLQFWNNAIVSEMGRRFLLPNVFVNDDCATSRPECLNTVITLYDELTVYDYEGQQIQLVATIIRNLVLDPLNSRIITQSDQCMRLIILCCYASHYALRQLGLAILSMLSFPVVGVLSETLAEFLVNLVSSEDRLDRLRGLEILSRLSDQKVCIDNTEFLNSLPKSFFVSLISMLIIHDLHIVVLALEAVYGMSDVDSCLCTKLVTCSSETLPTLYILLSLEAQVMGTQSLIRIRVMQGPGMVTSSSGVMNRTSVAHSQSSTTQLATSLMPPPPVPTHKIPSTTVYIPHTNVTRPHIYPTTEAPATLNRPQIIQKIYPVTTRDNEVHQTQQTNCKTPNSMPPIVKTELITTSIISPRSSAIVTQDTSTVESHVDHQTNDTIPMTIPSNNGTHPNPPPCTSPTLTNQRPPNKAQSPTVLTAHVFQNKQDFVKNWLLSNYLESAQCTVPLFVMYKQLQVAVQNYFKDSEMVTAEEFHRLVRVLFPQVQLVQLHTTTGAVEIHYYNLKVSSKIATANIILESHSSNCKPIQTSQLDKIHSGNSVPHIHNGQLVTTEDDHHAQKSSKRHATEMVNGHACESERSDHSPQKRPRTTHECVDESQNSGKPSKHIMSHAQNGLVTQSNQSMTERNKDLLKAEEKHIQSKVDQIQIHNGSNGEELKHFNSGTKTYSITPVLEEIVTNGNDYGSEGTIETGLGRVNINHPIAGAPIVTDIAALVSNGNVILPSETGASITDSSPNKRPTKKNSFNQLGRARSRFQNNTPGTKCKQRSTSSHRPHNLSYLYICEWDHCLQSFDKPQKVYGHVYTNHFMTLRTEVESICFWAGCDDTTQRTPLPLLNHVNEQHCNNVALESARQIRLSKLKETETLNATENDVVKSETQSMPKLLNIVSSQPNIQPTVDPPASVAISSPNTVKEPIISTASSIITSNEPICSTSLQQTQSPIVTATSSASITHEDPIPVSSSGQVDQSPASETIPSKPVQQEMIQPSLTISVASSSNSQSARVVSPTIPSVKHTFKEGPVTKHIRFLSALILRNLCQCSSDARRFVAARHRQIFEMSINGCESSRVLSECLFYSSSEIADIGDNRQDK